MNTKLGAAAMTALLIAACSDPPPPPRTDEGANSLFAQAPALRARLPNALNEVSGLAVTADGRVFAHDDERAVVYEIDPDSGAIVKRFALGEHVFRGDFEAITATPDGALWMTTSDGQIYRFTEAGTGEYAPFERFDTGAGALCEVEGLAFFTPEQRFVLACKRNRDEALVGAALLLTWKPGEQASEWMRVPEDLAEATNVRRFQPSSIEFDTRSGRIILLSANDAAMVELAPDGTLLSARQLEGPHRQPEGSALLPDGSLLIADEAAGGQARLTRYPRAP